jgi:KipI family sensor histidine kinase inhibitor
MTSLREFNLMMQPYGDSALLIDIEADSTDASTNVVMALNTQLKQERIRGIISTTPSYTSLLVCFDSARLQKSALQIKIQAIADAIDTGQIPQGRQWSLPACFDEGFALDRAALEDELSRDWQSIIECFCSTNYRVNAIGFLPGFTYLGNLPSGLNCSRMKNPRAKVPSSSIAIAGNQAGLYPLDSPGGWRIIGRLPLPIFRAEASEPAIFQPNDRITFKSVTPEIFRELREQPVESLIKQARG